MKNLLLTFTLILAVSTSWTQPIAFPGAEGYGKYAKGGRGGVVYEVTNLNDSGKGSLRLAVEASEPRTVIFRISGTIELQSPLKISYPFITIAGQTAPGDGICIKNYPLIIDADHVILRYLRIRLGDESGGDYDAISGRFIKNVIIDHVSASWSVDETMSIYHCDSITVQWCIVSESLFNSNHEKGNHGFGGIWGANYSTYHHNLLAHHSSRNPRMASGSGFTDFRNNVIYNWGYNSCYGGEKKQSGKPQFSFSEFNIVANYYKPGPATKPDEISHRIANPHFKIETDNHGKWYISDNVMEGNSIVTSDNWNGGVQTKNDSVAHEKLKLEKPWPSMLINQQNASEALNSVLQNAGATLPKRDAIDTRIIEETRLGIAIYEGNSYEQKYKVVDASKKCGMIDSQNDVGGWPILSTAPAPYDTDHDGIPDYWEDEYNLDSKNPEDRNFYDADGYTMLEKYINDIEIKN